MYKNVCINDFPVKKTTCPLSSKLQSRKKKFKRSPDSHGIEAAKAQPTLKQPQNEQQKKENICCFKCVQMGGITGVNVHHNKTEGF